MTIKIEQVAVITRPPEVPPYSLHGYCVAADGTTYTLLRQWWHGALLALLYPDEAKQAGYKMPEDPRDVNVYEFQRFELDNHSHFPVIRICPGRMLSGVSLDRGCDPSTPEQVEAVRLVLKSVGLTANDQIVTDHRDIKVRNLWDFLINDTDIFGSEKREVEKRPLVQKGKDLWALDEEDDADA